MTGVKQFLVLVVLAAGSAGQAWANMAPPWARPPDTAGLGDTTPLAVIVDRHQTQTRLLIPKKLLGGVPEFQQLPPVTPRQQRGGDIRNRTVVAGVTLSLFLMGGGAVTVLVRRRRVRAAVVTSIALVTLLGLCVSMAVADIPPRPANSSPFELAGPFSDNTPSTLPLALSFSGSLVIQSVDQGDRVTLIIGRDLAGKFAQIGATPPSPGANAGLGSAAPQ